MKQTYKLMLIALIAILSSYAASIFLQETSTASMQEYETLYHQLKQKQEVSSAEKERLEQLFKKINSAENIKSAITQDIGKHVIFFVLLIPALIFGGRYAKLDKDGSLYASGIIFLAFILSGAVIISAIAGTVFFFASHTARQSVKATSSD